MSEAHDAMHCRIGGAGEEEIGCICQGLSTVEEHVSHPTNKSDLSRLHSLCVARAAPILVRGKFVSPHALVGMCRAARQRG